jgi:shikimate dehydrogenase
MFPDTNEAPNIPYHLLTNEHLLFDLVYNPEVTLFMQKGIEKGCKVKNGYEMLVIQAELGWKILRQ